MKQKYINKNIILKQFNLLIKQISYDIDFSSNELHIKHMYRLKSINNVIKLIEQINKTHLTIDDFKGIKGIGTNSLNRINEIINTKKLSEINLTKINHQYLKYIENLEQVFGIGKSTAYNLYTKYNIKNISDLKTCFEKKKLVLPNNIVKGLKYFDMINYKIPYSEINDIYIFLINILYDIDLHLFGIICGSYRRLQMISGDIDFIIVHPNIITKKDIKKYNYLQIVIKKLFDINFLVDSFTSNNVTTKYMGLFKWKNNQLKRIDIRYIPYESYYSAILYFTGSKNFNKKIRYLALKNNLLLNEYGLFKNNVMIPLDSEKKIFDLLNIDYLTPDKRT